MPSAETTPPCTATGACASTRSATHRTRLRLLPLTGLMDQFVNTTTNAPETSPMGASSPVSVPAPTTWEDDPLWFKDAIVYELPVKAFFDSNNDGMGDFRGLTAKL